MRPLIVVLNQRSRQALTTAARFWDAPVSDDVAELVGTLYPILTDPWQLILGIERIGPTAYPPLLALAHRRVALAPRELALALGEEESRLLPILRQLYGAAIIASESGDDGLRLFLPSELIRLVLRLERERDDPASPEMPLDHLLERLPDHELLEVAERYGMPVVPTASTRREATEYLLARMQRPDLLGSVRTKLSGFSTELLDLLCRERRAVPLQVLIQRTRGRFGDLRKALSELAHWGTIWHTTVDGHSAVFVPLALSSSAQPAGSLPTSEAVETFVATTPTLSLADLLVVLSRGLTEPAERRGLHEALVDPLSGLPGLSPDPFAYPAFLERCARALGLLRSDNGVDLTRLRMWLRLPFAEQARRLLRTWRSVPEEHARARRYRMLERLRALHTETWYAWTSLFGTDLGDDERQEAWTTYELVWLGILALGRTASGVRVVRLTDWGTWLLERSVTPPPDEQSLVLRLAGCPDLTLSQPNPSIVWLASRLGDVERVSKTLVAVLSARQVSHYLRWVARVEEAPPDPDMLARVVRQQLARATGGQLPPTWDAALRSLFAQHRTATARQALVLAFAREEDRERAEQLLAAERWQVTRISAAELLITGWDHRQRAQLLAALRRGGFVVEWTAPATKRTSPSATGSARRPAS